MTIELRKVESIEKLHEIFSEKLGFPSYYGMNWDAFWDTITGLVEMPSNLTLSGWSMFQARFPKDSKILLEIVEEYNKSMGKNSINLK